MFLEHLNFRTSNFMWILAEKYNKFLFKMWKRIFRKLDSFASAFLNLSKFIFIIF